MRERVLRVCRLHCAEPVSRFVCVSKWGSNPHDGRTASCAEGFMKSMHCDTAMLPCRVPRRVANALNTHGCRRPLLPVSAPAYTYAIREMGPCGSDAWRHEGSGRARLAQGPNLPAAKPKFERVTAVMLLRQALAWGWNKQVGRNACRGSGS